MNAAGTDESKGGDAAEQGVDGWLGDGYNRTGDSNVIQS